MFDIEFRHLPNLSIQNVLKRISENSNPPGPDGCYRAHIVTVYHISRPPLSQNPPPTPGLCASVEGIVLEKIQSSKLKRNWCSKKLSWKENRQLQNKITN